MKFRKEYLNASIYIKPHINFRELYKLKSNISIIIERYRGFRGFYPYNDMGNGLNIETLEQPYQCYKKKDKYGYVLDGNFYHTPDYSPSKYANSLEEGSISFIYDAERVPELDITQIVSHGYGGNYPINKIMLSDCKIWISDGRLVTWDEALKFKNTFRQHKDKQYQLKDIDELDWYIELPMSASYLLGREQKLAPSIYNEDVNSALESFCRKYLLYLANLPDISNPIIFQINTDLSNFFNIQVI